MDSWEYTLGSDRDKMDASKGLNFNMIRGDDNEFLNLFLTMPDFFTQMKFSMKFWGSSFHFNTKNRDYSKT